MIEARPLPATTRNAAVDLYNEARITAARIMQGAAKLEGLPDILKAHGTACGDLCSLRMQRIVNEADPADFAQLREDLERVAAIIDPLVSAIGAEAAKWSFDINPKLFERQLFNAIDGDATENLDDAARLMVDDAPNTAADFQRDMARA